MIITETISSAAALLRRRAAQSLGRSVVETFKRWWTAYTAWRIERRAIAELSSMSDDDLKDIGINRCEILRAVRGDTARERSSVYDTMPISCAMPRSSKWGHPMGGTAGWASYEGDVKADVITTMTGNRRHVSIGD